MSTRQSFILRIAGVFLVQASTITGFCAAQTNDQKTGLQVADTNQSAKISSEKFAQHLSQNDFEAADTNRDGKISPDEFKHYVKQTAFSKIDKDGDGKIDKKEWQAADLSPRADVNFEKIATNRDKTVGFLEFSPYADKNYNYDEMFNALDRNRDGSLAPDEFNARPAFTIFSIKF